MMTVIWIVAIIVFGIAEAATAGLVSIWFVAGSIAALVVCELGGKLWLQFVLFFAVSVFALIATRPLARKALDKTCTLTPKLFFQAAAQLGAMNADPIGDSYIAIIHPYAAYDLKTSKEFIPLSSNASVTLGMSVAW